jgi:2'-5' RNA ligase
MAGTRAFIAIEPDKVAKAEIVKLLSELSQIGGIVSVKPENLHFTLFFFASLPDAELRLVKEVMKVAQPDAFEITLKGVGIFAHKNEPRVIYVDAPRSAALKGLHAVLSEGLTHARISAGSGDRGFSPHITIARVKGPLSQKNREALMAFREKHGGRVLGRFLCRSVVLKRSLLGGDAPVYTDLFALHLKPPAASTG